MLIGFPQKEEHRMSMHTENEVILVGNVGKDPEIRITKSGKAVTNISLATNGSVDREGNQKVQWHDITLWERLAIVARDWVQGGTRLYVKGRIEYGSYIKMVGGEEVKIPTTSIIASKVILLGNTKAKSDEADNLQAELEEEAA
jgi:single-strand DNA-binding protein